MNDAARIPCSIQAAHGTFLRGHSSVSSLQPPPTVPSRLPPEYFLFLFGPPSTNYARKELPGGLPDPAGTTSAPMRAKFSWEELAQLPRASGIHPAYDVSRRNRHCLRGGSPLYVSPILNDWQAASYRGECLKLQLAESKDREAQWVAAITTSYSPRSLKFGGL